MKKKKIAVVVKTIGLEYDDRIRKECISLSTVADVYIYAIFDNNIEKEGITSYGMPYKSFRLKTRDKLESGKYLFIKSIDFYLTIKKLLKEYDILWACGIYTYIFALLSKRDQCVWDLYEIPSEFENCFMKPIFHHIERKCIKLIHANKYRIDYMIAKKIIIKREKHLVIRNYPDKQLLSVDINNKNNIQFLEWLKKEEYIYLQGLSTSRRYPLNTIEAVMQACELKAIVIGDVEKNAKKNLENKYLDKICERIFFMGMIDQLQIPAYINDALFSIVLYDTNTPNNRFCDPNRLYQAIALKVPVIVGCNEPMKELVDRYKIGICLKSDGRELPEIIEAIKCIIKNNNIYRNNIQRYGHNFLWEVQESSLLNVLKKQALTN
jgi:glycosyltransferase involved in cell wall biosynthesis